VAGIFAVATVLIPAILYAPQATATVIGLGVTLSLAWRRTATVLAAAAVTVFGLLELGFADVFLRAKCWRARDHLLPSSLRAALGERAGLALGLVGPLWRATARQSREPARSAGGPRTPW